MNYKQCCCTRPAELRFNKQNSLRPVNVFLQIKNSLAKAFSMSKKSNSKPDSISVHEADTVSIQSDISSSDFTIDSITSPLTSRTADW
jgi:hypothetical protein